MSELTERMYIGSGDVGRIMMGANTKGYHDFLKEFVSGEKPCYNALASPIDALRTGAILEESYYQTLSDDFYVQYKVVCKEMDVFRCSLDFAKLSDGKVVDFQELKTVNFDDYLPIGMIKEADEEEQLEFVRKKRKSNYIQVQQQLLCTGLAAAHLVFLCVESYDDCANEFRRIEERDYTRIRIPRDESIIASIKERGAIFQSIKDYYTKQLKK
jgi:hypothetical protein